MFIRQEENLTCALDFWQAKPSGSLMWSLDAGTSSLLAAAKQAGYNDVTEFKQKELGCLIWGTNVDPTESTNNFVEIVEKNQDDGLHIEYRCSAGTLTEVRIDKQIIKHKVSNPKELSILIKMWQNTSIAPATEKFDMVKQQDKNKWPVLVSHNQASAVQHMLQHETGVADFWYLLMDSTDLIEEAMDVWQQNLQKKYQIMQTVPADGWYQAENTSTTMISPAYYEKYSLEHMRCFADSARKANCRSLVHMCGLLHNIMPLIKQTGMNGIHNLTPPTIGDTPFEYAYDLMPDDFLALGGFGSLDWINRTREEILANLAKKLPHHIYQKHAFTLLVTSDEADFNLDNLYLVRDCINEYEQIAN